MTSALAISADQKTRFRENLLQWHTEKNTRQMPWKGEKDPYKIWLSEVILQQTRVQQGWQYYQRFIENYPTVTDLGKAPDDDVFKLWEGLGYYSRCKNLLSTARYIAFERNGVFPDTHKDILDLKGVGPYTAAAIASFAYNLPHAVVDGNVYRVLARYFGIATPIDAPAGKLLFATLANECLDADQPAAYNQSIMDFGATVCTPASPLCPKCPLQTDCTAYKDGLIQQLPIKNKTLQKTVRWFTYFIIESKGSILVRKRTERDIWQNLHEFYLAETEQVPDWNERKIKQFLKDKLGYPVAVKTTLAPVRQQLTHQTIFITFIRVVVDNEANAPGDYFFQKQEEISKLAFPKTLKDILNQPFMPSLF